MRSSRAHFLRLSMGSCCYQVAHLLLQWTGMNAEAIDRVAGLPLLLMLPKVTWCECSRHVDISLLTSGVRVC